MTLTKDHVDALESMHTALISDVTDEMGITDNVLDPDICPIWSEDPVVGTAHTIQNVPIAYEMESWEEHASMHLEAIDAIESRDMVVHVAPDEVTAGLWGELLSTSARTKGAVGTIIDGYVRDARMIEEDEFPVWAKGSTPADAYGRCYVKEYGETVDAGGVTVNQGDIIIADYEGVVAMPADEIDTIVDRATELHESEGNIRSNLRQDHSIWNVVNEHGQL